MSRIPTVMVNRKGNKVLINKSDFNPQRDVLWDAAPLQEKVKELKPVEEPETKEDVGTIDKSLKENDPKLPRKKRPV